jgi:hypothetical protein
MFKFEVITVVAIKIAVFLDVTPYSLMDVYQRFKDPCYFQLQERRIKQSSLPVGNKCTRVKVLTEVSVKIDVFRYVAPCSLVDVYGGFRGICCFHFQDMIGLQ